VLVCRRPDYGEADAPGKTKLWTCVVWTR
jgi:hypothetical protein